MKHEAFWDECTSDMHERAKENESFYRNDSSCRRIRLSADIVLMFNTLLIFFGFVSILCTAVYVYGFNCLPFIYLCYFLTM